MAIVNKKIVLITSGQPSLNPRLVKEADALVEDGYDVIVIYQYWNKWGTELDKELIPNKKWTAIRVGGDPILQKRQYLFTRLQFKLAHYFIKLLGVKNKFAELAIGRCAYQLTRKAIGINADLYIAHNLAALPAAVIAAKRNNAKCGFDAEDFHRNEVSDNPNSIDVKLKSFVEDKYIHRLDYLTTASPLISKAYKELYPKQNPITLLNVFPKNDFVLETKSPGSLKLFWFSQTIGKGRGLEEVINVMGQLKESAIELHLLGDFDSSTRNYFDELVKINGLSTNCIFYYLPIASTEIFKFGSKFDIGLATEVGTPKNRDICLTNKIFSYIHSNLAIIASNTSAQELLLKDYPNIGYVYQIDEPITLVAKLNQYLDNRSLLAEHQQQALKYAIEVLNWDKEKEKFLSLINTLTPKKIG